MTGAPDKSTAAASFARRYQVSLASQFKVMLFGAQDPRSVMKRGPAIGAFTHGFSSRHLKSSQVRSRLPYGCLMVVSSQGFQLYLQT